MRKSKLEQPKKFLSIRTKYGVVEKVPFHPWREMSPYWPSICRAIFEVLVEDDFYPYTATLKRRKGFVASSYYWKISNKNPKALPLSEARYFIYKLKEKPDFVNSIRQFNLGTGKDWLEESNIGTLGGYLYSFCLLLKPVLEIVKDKDRECLKPIFK